MNKRMLMVLVFVGMIFLVGGVEAKEKVFSVSAVYRSGNVSIGDVFVANATYFERSYVGDYVLKVLDVDGGELYVRNFDFILDYVQGPPIEGEEFDGESFSVEDAEEVLLIPYFDGAENMEIYFDGEMVAEKYVGYLTGSCGDGICKPHESVGDCVVDCVEEGEGEGFDWKFLILFAVIVTVIIVAWWLIRNVMKEGSGSRLG